MNRFEIAARVLIGCSALCCAAGGAAFAWRRRRAGWVLTGAGWAGTAVLVVLNGLVVRGPPLGNMYQVVTFLAACFAPLFLLLSQRERLGWAAPYFTLLAVVPLAGAFFMRKDTLWRRMPALQSAWFVPHVLAYMIAYSLATAAAALLAAKWIRRRNAGAAQRNDAAAHAVLRFAFPFLTFGMLSGALWAEQAWGRYWSWDPKETWSLIMWMFYAIYLHAWNRPDLRRYADLAHLLGYASLLVTFLLVNLLPKLGSLLHGYA